MSLWVITSLADSVRNRMLRLYPIQKSPRVFVNKHGKSPVFLVFFRFVTKSEWFSIWNAITLEKLIDI